MSRNAQFMFFQKVNLHLRVAPGFSLNVPAFRCLPAITGASRLSLINKTQLNYRYEELVMTLNSLFIVSFLMQCGAYKPGLEVTICDLSPPRG